VFDDTYVYFIILVKFRLQKLKTRAANNISIIFGSKFGAKKRDLTISVKILNAFLQTYKNVISISHFTCDV